jgi:hypothetical protein
MVKIFTLGRSVPPGPPEKPTEYLSVVHISCGQEARMFIFSSQPPLGMISGNVYSFTLLDC